MRLDTATLFAVAALFLCSCGGAAAPPFVLPPEQPPTEEPPPVPPPAVIGMDFGPIQFLSGAYSATYQVDLEVRDESDSLLGTASGSLGVRRLDPTTGVSSPYNADPEPYRNGAYFDLLAGNGTATQGWAWTYFRLHPSEGAWSYGGLFLDQPGSRWWWDTAINYSDLSGTRYGVVRDWMPTIRTGQTFNYGFDLVARYEGGALAFTQTNTHKAVGGIEVVSIPLGRYEAYRVTTGKTREAANGLWTFSSTIEHWRPDMGLLQSVEFSIQTLDFVSEQRSSVVLTMTSYTP